MEGRDGFTTIFTTWLTPLLGLAEIGLLVFAVYLTIAQFTRSRASSYIERFNSSDAIESRLAVDSWIEAHDTSMTRLEGLEQNPELRTHLRRIANLFQELGAAYQFGVAHRKTVRVLFDSLVVMYWERLRFWVEDYRANSDPTLYARFEYLYHEIKLYERKRTCAADYVVAYGSLMSPESLGAALGRDVSLEELIPIEIKGWARQWNLGESIRLSGAKKTTVAAFLNLEATPGKTTSAAMIKVMPSELERLKIREKNYDALDLHAAVRLVGNRRVGPDAAVWCFIGRDRHRITAGTDEAVILEAYLRKVEQAANKLDPSAVEEIQTSASEAGFKTVPGSYRFSDPDQQSLV